MQRMGILSCGFWLTWCDLVRSAGQRGIDQRADNRQLAQHVDADEDNADGHGRLFQVRLHDVSLNGGGEVRHQ